MNPDEFLAKHEAVLRAALIQYVYYMTAESQKALAAYNHVKDDPVMKVVQDNSVITTEGLRMSDKMFAGSSKFAEKALKALDSIKEEREE